MGQKQRKKETNNPLTENMKTLSHYKNVCIISSEGGETQAKGTENIFKKLIENNLYNLRKEIPWRIRVHFQ